MSTSTVQDRAAQHDTAPRHTPRVEVDVPTALSAVHTADRQLAPDPRGGTLLDLDHPAMGPLLPYLGATGTWALLSDPAGIDPAHRATRFTDTVVLDARAARPGSARRSPADVVVLPIEQVGPGEVGPAVLVDIGGLPHWRLGSEVFAAGGVAGFHVEVSGPVDPAAEARATATIVCGLRRWAEAGRADRPLLVLRGARTLSARRIVGAVVRTCRFDSLPAPVWRVDVSATVLDVAVRTVVRVLAVDRQGDRALLHLDALPAAVTPALQVLHPRGGTTLAPEHVLIAVQGRLRTARLYGGPAVPGSELAATGWVETMHPLVVRGF